MVRPVISPIRLINENDLFLVRLRRITLKVLESMGLGFRVWSGA